MSDHQYSFASGKPEAGERNMADFVQTTNTKTAVRELAAPIADVNAFNTIVAGVIADNPWNCTAYTAANVPLDPVVKNRGCAGKIIK
jgi:hypothetical protein